MWDSLREWYFVFIEPLLVYFGLTTWGQGDPTYGRNALPYSPLEREAIYDNDAVKVTRRRVYLCRGKPVLDTSLGEHITTVPHAWGKQVIDAWVNYYVWEMPHVPQRMNADVYLAHGINDYSALGLMMAGFRTIALDMPSFGRSTGLHAYVPDLRLNTNALDAVLYHVYMWDEVNKLENLVTRKRFAQGSSMGGFTVLYHAALHPPMTVAKLGNPTDRHHLALDGVAVSAPMLQIAPESRPGLVMEMVGRMLATVAGRLPLLRAIKGKISDDPKVEYYAALDPQVYHGFVRIGTALAIVAGLDHVNEIVAQVQCPVAIHHGSHDRVTTMLKSTPEMSVEDVERRNAVIQAIASWFLQLC
ncbi:hypothetical protein CBS14141_001964 [Malassezia furfur]|nr:hypothetical protein CBS14141_001964 [Malassezia furfur]